MKEIWKSIFGYEGLYEISNMGRVRRCYDSCRCSTRIAKIGENRKGYSRVNLHKKGKLQVSFVHLLVLNNFIGQCPKGKEASHLNDIKADNRLENLAWMTRSENKKLRFVNKRQSNKGEKHPMYGRKHSLETRMKMRQAQQKRRKKERSILQ